MRLKLQAGLTLIEVMISLTLGVIFLMAAISFLVSGRQSFQAQDSGTRIQENSRFAMEFIRKSARMAGYTEAPLAVPDYIYRGSCGTVNGVAAANCSDDVASTATTQGDRLAFSMTHPDAVDCTGSAVGSANTQFANVFWVQIVDGVSSLYCQGYNIDTGAWIGTAQPLVSGIDQLQVQYGVAPDADSPDVERYYSASGVPAGDWQNVRSVKIGLVVNAGGDFDEAENDIGTLDNDLITSQYTNFNVLDSTFDRTAAADDRRLRRVYTGVVAFNNVSIPPASSP